MPHIPIVGDEATIANILLYVLQAEDFITTWVTLVGEVPVLRERQSVGLLILDVGSSDISGFEARKRLRRFSEAPVILLTARGAEINRMVGLEIGADDYIVRPFSSREVAARVKVTLKRTASRPAVLERATPSGPFQVDEEHVRTCYRDILLSFTRREFRLLQTLLEQPERAFSCEQLFDALGITSEAGHEHNINNHIKNLRAKLRQVNECGRMVQTYRGLGYSYSPDRA